MSGQTGALSLGNEHNPNLTPENRAVLIHRNATRWQVRIALNPFTLTTNGSEGKTQTAIAGMGKVRSYEAFMQSNVPIKTKKSFE